MSLKKISGGYSKEEANTKLKENEYIIANFSRALSEDLNVNQSDEEFHAALKMQLHRFMTRLLIKTDYCFFRFTDIEKSKWISGITESI